MLSDCVQFLRALISLLVIPPAGLLWLMILGIALRRSRPRFGRTVFGVGLALLYALSMPAMDGLLITSLESKPPAPAELPVPGAIIVLGGDGDRRPDSLIKAEPGQLSLQRLAGAAILERRTHLPVLMTGGVLGPDQPAVAELMADLFTGAFGLPVAWREDRAGNTCENARFSAEILRQSGIPAAYVVTHAWHMPRAILAFRQAGYPIVPAPLSPDALAIRGIADFLPHTSAWIRSYYAIHEWIGLAAYRLGACPPAVGGADATSVSAGP